ncbi:uncharacterized protein LOC126891267 [Diabrotica virgifera virgifera]|uniref:ISXO2-like transposase domain-containing protein n=1 Tax=Diabrotica virgifera virgifera TaxID=50390 RepID=A0ABM5L1T8_DIAVI|nr:uncharacterized protein LOC126891267 [Diabrotica virgifera virgifera]
MACVEPCSIGVFEGGYMAKTKDEVPKFFVNHKVLKDVIVCRYGNTLKMDGKMTFRCNKMVLRKKRGPKKCGFCISARKGTFHENSKLAIDKIFLLVNLLLNWGPPRQEAALEELGISSSAMVDWYSYCREVFISFAINNSTKLGGPGSIIEIDEAKFGKRKFNRSRLFRCQWLFGGYERSTGNFFVIPVERRDADTLLGIIRDWILPGTTIYSDCWKAYNCLAHEGFHHQTVNHSKHFVDPETGTHSNHIERLWREVRSNIPKYGVKEAHFVGYLAEFYFKRRYTKRLERMHHFFKAASELYPPAY